MIGFDEARLLHIRRGAPVPGNGHGGTLVADPPSATAAIGASETEERYYSTCTFNLFTKTIGARRLGAPMLASSQQPEEHRQIVEAD